MKKLLLLACSLMASHQISAQCPVVTCPATVAVPCSTTGFGPYVSASSNYSANISSKWFSPNGLQLTSTGTSTSIVNINCAGTYSVQFTDNVSGCVTTQTLTATSASNVPIFNPTSQSGTTLYCSSVGVDLHFSDANTNPSGGAISYTLNPIKGNIPPVFGQTVDHLVYQCGNTTMMVKDNFSGCISSFDIFITCPPPATISISGPPGNTICANSSAVLTVTGTAVVYNWVNLVPATTTILAAPTATSGTVVYTVSAMGLGSMCPPIIETYTLTIDPNCSPTNTSVVTGIEKTNTSAINYHLFPNPASTNVEIRSSAASETHYSLTDLTGKNMDNGNFRETMLLNVSSLPEGIYLLKLNSGSESIYRKIVVTH